MEPVFLSIVIPAYNEERRILPTLTAIMAYLREQAYSAEVLVVNDGSTDATAPLAAEFARDHPGLEVVDIPHGGKGHAVRAGMLKARGQFRFLCDADLAMPIHQIDRFLPPRLGGVDVAVGSREAPGARRHDEPPYRHAMGRAFNWVVRAVAVRGIRDTQCGFKCYTARAATALFSRQVLDGFGFDVEVLFLARKQGLVVVEVPIDWYHQRESKVRPVRDTFRMLREAFQVQWNYRTGRYRRPSEGAARAPRSS